MTLITFIIMIICKFFVIKFEIALMFSFNYLYELLLLSMHNKKMLEHIKEILLQLQVL